MQPAKNANHEPPPPADQAAQQVSATPLSMTFKNEVVTDADIERYKLPFNKGDRRWWTRDAERDYYLWGGLSGNLAFDREQEGWFSLYVDGVSHVIKLLPGRLSDDLTSDPYLVNWKGIIRIEPNPKSSWKKERLIRILKEALTAHGLTGENDFWPKNCLVSFDF
jgi:hypothetical protein